MSNRNQPIIKRLTNDFHLIGSIMQDAPAFLRHHDCPKTAAHVTEVAAEAHRLALHFGLNTEQAQIAGVLHDISAVWPVSQRTQIARTLGVEILPEETILPMILHQKLSMVIAREIFHITDEAILSAIGCHTTLKPDATPMDMLVFVADKIAWDQPGRPPYIDAVLAALDESLAAASLAYLTYLLDRRDQLKVVHPWAEAAYQQLCEQI